MIEYFRNMKKQKFKSSLKDKILKYRKILVDLSDILLIQIRIFTINVEWFNSLRKSSKEYLSVKPAALLLSINERDAKNSADYREHLNVINENFISNKIKNFNVFNLNENTILKVSQMIKELEDNENEEEETSISTEKILSSILLFWTSLNVKLYLDYQDVMRKKTLT